MGFADKLITEVVSRLVVLWVLRGLRLRRLRVLAKRLAYRAMPSPSVRVFFGGKTSPCFDLSIHWLIKQITNTYFKVIRKSFNNLTTPPSWGALYLKIFIEWSLSTGANEVFWWLTLFYSHLLLLLKPFSTLAFYCHDY